MLGNQKSIGGGVHVIPVTPEFNAVMGEVLYPCYVYDGNHNLKRIDSPKDKLRATLKDIRAEFEGSYYLNMTFKRMRHGDGLEDA